MEALSTASGVIAVVSVTVQLAESIKKLCDFWSEVKNAPEDITAMIQELRLLDLVLTKIHANELNYGTDPTTTIVLERCAEKVNALMAAMDSFQPGFASRKWQVRTWNSFKVTLQSKRFLSLRLSLEEMKTTLILARQDLSERMQYTFRDQNLTAINDGFAGLHLRQSSTAVTTATSGPADLIDHITDLRTEIKSMTTAISVPWLKAGMQIGMDQAVQDLITSLKTNTIPTKHSQTSSQEPPIRLNSLGQTVDKDIEHGKSNGLTMPALLRRRSRRRYMEASYSSMTSSFFGKFYFTTRRYQIKIGSQTNLQFSPIDHYEYETHFVVHPAPWLLRCGLSFGLDVAIIKSIKGWKNNIRTFRAVVDDALIFDFCKEGNTQEVKSLLSRGEASPWDTDSRGWTPLHFAFWICNLELCKLLLEAGADKTALTYDFPEGNYEVCSPLVTASTMNRNHKITATQRVNTLRLFLSDLETNFTDHESQEWNMLLVLLERERASSEISSNTDVSAWVLDTFAHDIKGDHPMPKIAWLLTFSLEARYLTQKVLDMSNNMVNAAFDVGGFTAVHAKIAEGFSDSVIPSIKLLAERGADFHTVGCTTGYGANGMPQHDAPPSIAMRRSTLFSKWCALLRELATDFPSFVQEEMEKNPTLIKDGWSYVSLLTLFDTKFEPVEMPDFFCDVCNREVYRLYEIKEEGWERFLDEVKNCTKADTCAEDVESSSDSFSSAREIWSIGSSRNSLLSFGTRKDKEASKVDAERFLCWKCGIVEGIRTTGYSKIEIAKEEEEQAND